MSKKNRYQKQGDGLDDPQLWKVEPGYAIGILKLGTPRDELFEILKERNFDIEEIELEESEFYVMEMDTTLYFGAEHPYPIELIEISDERARFGTLKVLNDYPHNLFSTIPSTSTLWFDDLSQITSAYTGCVIEPPITDATLMDGGTLWMTDLGFGFKLTQGKTTTLFLCDPSKLPESGYGEFTGEQRHLSEKMQLASFRTKPTKTHPLETVIKIGLLLIAIAVAAYFGKQAWDEEQHWNNAPEVEAEVVSVWPPPPEVFPSKYQLAFSDNSGSKHEVELERNDLYGIPKVGEKVTLRYLPESPQTVKGPAKVQNIAFDRFVPYLLGTVAVYFVLHFMSDFFVSRFLRK